jgi:hypothetical protein
MAAFASCRRSGWVRVLVVILCALFIFATIATPPAYAVGETFALFGAAAVLSSAVAALGFKLSNDSDGIATLNKMVSDFVKEAWALNVLVVGNRINGLINGMNYIKMAVHNGKTYLDERVVAWCQQWLGNNGVYDSGGVSVSPNMFSEDGILAASGAPSFPIGLRSYLSDGNYFVMSQATFDFSYIQDYFGLESLPDLSGSRPWNSARYVAGWSNLDKSRFCIVYSQNSSFSLNVTKINGVKYLVPDMTPRGYVSTNNGKTWNFMDYYGVSALWSLDGSNTVYGLANFLPVVQASNNTGLSGTDTIGADYKDKTLDQILDGLKTWAQDWYDAGADSATNTATGALDLPVTVGDQAATANPALNPDVVYNPPFSIPWPGVRSGETSSGAISDGKANADAADTATTDVAENQSVIDSLVNWALNYINPDTGLFSKFPLCVPYDAYLLVTSSLGVDAVGSDSIFGASPGDLDGVVSQGIETYSDFQPIINIKHDFELDGATYPLELTIDLTPWQPLVTFFREGMALLLVAELIGAEFKRIRGH